MLAVEPTIVPSHYTVLQLLYSGSRTLVYQGICQRSQQPVVIKVLRNEFPSFRELSQFRQQYALTRELNIPGIVQPLSLEKHHNRYVLVMPDVGGISLADYIQQCDRQNPTALISQFLGIAQQLAEILNTLHHQRIIHKDIKPANILVHPQTQQIYLIDFSISSQLSSQTQQGRSPKHLEGTLAYISPEQTGRMNRGIDYRTDFYSLGVSLYEFLIGALPFQSDDPMELVHCHIAKQPPRLANQTHTSGEIPPVIAKIVMKLMAKNAEDRYQSGAGLKHDLNHCLQQWQKLGEIPDFELAQHDRSDRFTIPEKLYGREREVQQLLAAFERIAQPEAQLTSELMLVSGYSGIGKTAIVNEVHQPIVRQRGYFIKGKFDQFQRDIPFSAFIQALRDLMGQLLSESDAQIRLWQARILAVLGDSAQVMIDIVPELAQVLGIQPAAPELTGNAAQNRFNQLLQNFIQVFSSPDHPLVLFLDDMQWADSASLKLLQLLMGNPASQNRLIITAYRDHEVSPAHPWMITLDEMHKAGTIIHSIQLQPLSQFDLNHLIADTLICPLPVAEPLAALVYHKTQGNPFFAIQCLKSLHNDNLIEFDYERSTWQCDLTAVRSQALTDDVVEFMAQQLQKLALPTQSLLKLAACIGNQFDLAALAIVDESSLTDTASDLWVALQAGLILPISEIYQFDHDLVLSDGDALQTLETSAHNIHYRFLHDRVQQAAYSLIAESEQAVTHLKIGRLLLQQIPAAEPAQNILKIVSQLNRGQSLIDDPIERHQLASLNLVSGSKAKATTAYAAARSYLKTGMALLEANCWQTQYDLALALHQEAAEVAYLSADMAQMEIWVEIVLQQANSFADQLKAYLVQLEAYQVQMRGQEAIALGIQLLQKVGIELPENPSPEMVIGRFQETQALLADRAIESLLNLAPMDDPEKLAAMQILMLMLPVAYVCHPPLFPLIVFQEIQLSLTAGNCALSAHAYANYAVIICNILGDGALAYRWGQLATQVLAAFQARQIHSTTTFVINAFTRHWQEPLQRTLSACSEGYKMGLEMGDVQHATLCATIGLEHALFLGQELHDLEQRTAAYTQTSQRMGQEMTWQIQVLLWQLQQNLLGQSDDPLYLTGNACDESVMLPLYHQMGNRNSIARFHIYKGWLAYLFCQYELAQQHFTLAQANRDAVAAQFIDTILTFYGSLTAIALYTQSTPSVQAELLQQIAIDQAKLQQWAEQAPSNFQHKSLLVEAELQRVRGNQTVAMDLYDQAIYLAEAHQYPHEAALAAELAALAYQAWQKPKIAQTYMVEAYYGYAHWGNQAKTQALETHYRELLTPIFHPAMGESRHAELSSVRATTQLISTQDELHLDLSSILRASQTLSGEIKLEKLLMTLVQVLMANAGASKVALLLPTNDRWYIQALVESDQAPLILTNLPVSGTSTLPTSIVNYVKRRLEPMIIDDASLQTQFAGDTYFLQSAVKSLLCMPLLLQGKLIGILYLENNLLSHSLTHDRIEVLHLLAAQAAISIENATLYSTLEQKVIERTQALSQTLETLKATQKQLVEAEKMAALGGLVAGIAHEINTPVGVGITLSSSLVEATQQFKAAIADGQLKKSVLTNYLDTAETSSQLMLTNLQRAGDLIQSFKQIAVDQTHLEQRVIALKPYLEDILISLKPQLRQAQHTLTLSGDDTISLVSYPGAIAQLITNLLNNSLLHAYPTSQAGQLQIDLQASEASIRLTYRDDGCGIPAAILDRVFDPFFTTARDRGGSGLGLHIVYNLVTQKLGGTIMVESTVGMGTLFIIELPRMR